MDLRRRRGAIGVPRSGECWRFLFFKRLKCLKRLGDNLVCLEFSFAFFFRYGCMVCLCFFYGGLKWLKGGFAVFVQDILEGGGL